MIRRAAVSGSSVTATGSAHGHKYRPCSSAQTSVAARVCRSTTVRRGRRPTRCTKVMLNPRAERGRQPF